jgi:hypothetical protein
MRRLLHGLGAVLLLALALVPGEAGAQSLESALRPGELIEGHAKWDDDCSQCHVRFDRAAQNERCMSCHKEVGTDMRQRTGHHGRLKPQPCRACHTDHKGRSARIAEFDTRHFDHAQTDYLLQGRHRSVDCVACHPATRKYRQAPQDCLSCHRKDDTHKGSLGVKCADCHQEGDWKKTRFDHGQTRFALTGRHVDTPCADCHRVANYRETPRTCIGCHRKDDDTAKGHHGRFGDKCESCHGSKAWKPATFNHDNDTRWALRGKHRSAVCTTCHAGNPYRDKLGTACVDCHRKDDKHEGSLGRDCQACHAERDWKETARFDHDRSRYPLLGRHRDARCDACHAGGRYRDTPTDCASCHRKDDKHKPSLGDGCESCHAERSWKEATRFDHGKARFVLRERHAEVRCDACHRPGGAGLVDFRQAARECNGCHRKDDRHEGSLGSGCADCHGERRWTPAPRFDHQRTKFPLRHAHAARGVACKDCHADARAYRPTPQDCVSCHRKDDRHEAQLGTRCETCHDDQRWKSQRFDHAGARFVLIGRHLPLACDSCHKTLRHRDAPRDCDGCHRKDDKHALKYGTACDSCHNARSWALWTFDHTRRTRFALDGAHQRSACERCHTRPAPAGQAIAALGNTCIACHARDDKHDGAFGEQCDRCHVGSSWRKVTQRLGAGPAPASGALGQTRWFARRAGAWMSRVGS